MSRNCRCGCGASLDRLRADALYASDACRKRAKRAPSPDKARNRRPSRDGNGVRIYVAPKDDYVDVVHKVMKARGLDPLTTPAKSLTQMGVEA